MVRLGGVATRRLTMPRRSNLFAHVHRLLPDFVRVQRRQGVQFRHGRNVRLPDAVPAEVVASMRAGTWEALGARGITKRDPSTLARPDRHTWIAVKPTCSGGDAVGPDDSPAVRMLLDELLGPTRSSGSDWGKTLVALPERGSTWSVPGTAWHFDHLYRSPGVVTAVNLFLLLDDVAPRGGGTPVVRNSPQLLDRLLSSGAQFSKVSEQNRSFITSTEWTRGLTASKAARTAERTARYTTENLVEGIPMRVDELCGSAGDVFVCHPRSSTPSP